jgi:hypothetical protein
MALKCVMRKSILRIVLSVEERLSALFDRVTHGRATEQDTVRELRALHLDASDPHRIEKLRDAIMWTKIYFSSRRWKPWGSREKVRDFLLGEIYNARRVQ